MDFKRYLILAVLVTVLIIVSCGEPEDDYIPPNRHPDIEEIVQFRNGIATGWYDTLVCVATDPDDDVLSYAWTAYAGSLVTNNDTAIWYAPADAARYPFNVRIEDGRGGYDQRDFEVQVYVDSIYIPFETIIAPIRLVNPTLTVITSKTQYESLWVENHPDIDTTVTSIPESGLNFDDSYAAIISFGYGYRSGCDEDIQLIEYPFLSRDSLFFQTTAQGWVDFNPACFAEVEPRHWIVFPKVDLPWRFLRPDDELYWSWP